MFLQPMLLIEELEQLPYSLCKYMGKVEGGPMDFWTSFLKDLQKFVGTAPLSSNEVQKKIIWARTVNAQAGWLAPYGLISYQIVACDIQTRIEWWSLDDSDKESLNDHIRCCLSAPTHADLLPKASGSLEFTLAHGKKDSLPLYISSEVADPLILDIRESFRKIKNPTIRKKLLDHADDDDKNLNDPYDYTPRCVCCLARGGLVALLRCSRCKVPQYCGIKCQKEDWKQGHKHTCNTFGALTAIKIPDPLAEMLKKHRLDTLKTLGYA